LHLTISIMLYVQALRKDSLDICCSYNAILHHLQRAEIKYYRPSLHQNYYGFALDLARSSPVVTPELSQLAEHLRENESNGWTRRLFDCAVVAFLGSIAALLFERLIGPQPVHGMVVAHRWHRKGYLNIELSEDQHRRGAMTT
jgi:hypothetical protein